MQSQAEIIVGTLESYAIGYFVSVTEKKKLQLTCGFKEKSHLKKLKELHVLGNFLLSSGADESMKVFNLEIRREVATLRSDNGIINNMDSHGSMVYCGAEDGTIQIMKENHWEVIKKLKGAKKKYTSPVVSLSVHPSGKLALSITKDENFYIWNLKTQKLAASNKIKKPDGCIARSGLLMVLWSPLGDFYAMVCSNIVDIYNQETGDIVTSVDFTKPIYTVVFLSSDLLAVGGERNQICIFSIKDKKSLVQWDAHDNRIKALKLLPVESTNVLALISVSSDGFLKIWKILLKNISELPKLIGQVDTGCRITCLAVRSIPVNLKKNSARNANAEDTETKEPKRKKARKE